MVTHDLTVEFPSKLEPFSGLTSDSPKLYVSLVWTKPSDFGKIFRMKETNEVPGLLSLRGRASLDEFLSFHGATFSEALERWSTLRMFYDYRIESKNPEAYPDCIQIKRFYHELDRGNRPATVDIAIVEHY